MEHTLDNTELSGLDAHKAEYEQLQVKLEIDLNGF